jgi:CubicO group peptidase (beta-lactamase class C family)
VAKLQQVVDAAFVGAGDPNAANARGLAVVQHGRLLVARDAPGFAPGTALHGWSMTKSVAAMLTHKLAGEAGLPLDAPVVDAFPAGREPKWVADWRQDGRKDIKVMDLLYMRDGLASVETYDPWGAVPKMLWLAPDAAAWAAAKPLEAPPGSRWRYLSATANLMSAVDRGRFAQDRDYWQYPSKALFEPLGMKSATMETDPAGNWVGSSYLWASIGDWARMAQMMMRDGEWQGKQILPPGWLKRATTPSVAQGEGAAYTAMSYLYGDRKNGECKNYPGVPEDTLVWSGHWGQIVAMVPSKDAVVVRLGWVWKNHDECQLLSDVLATLPAK